MIFPRAEKKAISRWKILGKWKFYQTLWLFFSLNFHSNFAIARSYSTKTFSFFKLLSLNIKSTIHRKSYFCRKLIPLHVFSYFQRLVSVNSNITCAKKFRFLSICMALLSSPKDYMNVFSFWVLYFRDYSVSIDCPLKYWVVNCQTLDRLYQRCRGTCLYHCLWCNTSSSTRI